MIGTPARFTIRALLAASVCVLAAGVLGVVLPAGAGAYATVEGPPVFSTAPGLPDGRVYEQVSPADKNGNEAGATTNPYSVGAEEHDGVATADGNSVLFEGTGPMGESPSPQSQYFVASKNQSAAGWSTRALLPEAKREGKLVETLEAKPEYLDPSSDLSHAMVLAGKYALGPESTASCDGTYQLYLLGSDPFGAGTWLDRSATPDSIENCQPYKQSGVPDGGTPDFSTVYFSFAGTLLGEDASRAPYAGQAWGFYEDHEGILREAGVLPGGGVDVFGAVPAGSGHGRERAGNEVSADGLRAFFVSPDPAGVALCNGAEEGKGESAAQAAASCAPQLYVREDGDRTLLVSRDTLLPETGGLPAAAPDGVAHMPNPTDNEEAGEAYGAFVFASPDGAQAFFQSEDKLTAGAPEGPPGNREAKTYDFDVETGALVYLPGVVGQLVATNADGSSLAFVRPEAEGAPSELDLWSAGGAGGGGVTAITQLPGEGSVSGARMSSDGSVVVFATAALIAGFNNGGTHQTSGVTDGGSEQIYRYDALANTLGCVSCPPQGVTPTGDASMSSLQASETYEKQTIDLRQMVYARGISSDGDRVFFDTPDPLVPQDTNTNSPEVEIEQGTFAKQGRDVYEWENGVVYLISGGKSARNSLYLDSSENGDDVFFATTESLVPGDTDGGFDVYDARVPHPKDNPPTAAVPCEGSVCEGPPRVPSPLAAPASATFSGLGNPTPEAQVVSGPTKTIKKSVKCAKGKRLSHGKCVRKAKSHRAAVKRTAKGGR